MANKNAKNVTNGTDIFVVTPGNMGKGLAYNETNKQYEVNAKDANGVKVNSDGTVGVSLSKDGGNLLELRSDGLYYGTKAVQADFFVDAVAGSDDAGDGTYGNPFRTFNKALESLPRDKKGLNIHLKEGQTHVCNITNHTVTSSFTVNAYGSQFDALQRKYTNQDNGGLNQGWWQVQETVEYKRIAPTLSFVVVGTNTAGGVVGSANTFAWIENSDIRFNGIKFRYADPQNFGVPPNGQWRNLFGGLSGTLMFADCEIDNSNSGRQWNLFSDHDGSVSFKVWNLKVTNTGNEIAHIGAKMELEVVSYGAGGSSAVGDGLHRDDVLTVPEVIALIANKGEPPKANYNNLIVNY